MNNEEGKQAKTKVSSLEEDLFKKLEKLEKIANNNNMAVAEFVKLILELGDKHNLKSSSKLQNVFIELNQENETINKSRQNTEKSRIVTRSMLANLRKQLS